MIYTVRQFLSLQAMAAGQCPAQQDKDACTGLDLLWRAYNSGREENRKLVASFWAVFSGHESGCTCNK